MSIREDFLADIKKENLELWQYPKDIAFWASKWAIEKVADKVLMSDLSKMALASELRKMGQELSTEGGRDAS